MKRYHLLYLAEKLSVPSILALIIKWKTTIFMDNKLNSVNIRAEERCVQYEEALNYDKNSDFIIDLSTSDFTRTAFEML